jgi:hypothetical protein
MADNDSHRCTCSEEGYSPTCPQTFVQNGAMHHTLSGETQLKPRAYRTANLDTLDAARQAKNDEGKQKFIQDYGDPMANGPDGLPSVMRYLDMSDEIPPLLPSKRAATMNSVNLTNEQSQVKSFTESDMRFGTRVSLDRFKPLTIGESTLTEVSIGGYKLDVAKVAEKVAPFIELPPVALPLIFIDKELNFNHHFFQGLEMMLGRVTLSKMLRETKYSESDKAKVLPELKKLITEGYLPSDTELSMFVKRILSVTFETLPTSKVTPENDGLLVATNVYGFQYLEQGMFCRDSDLRMWLSIENMRFKMSWFNAFKSSGVPYFATSGVQERYESDEVVEREKRRRERSDRRETKAESTDVVRYSRRADPGPHSRGGRDTRLANLFKIGM